MTEHRQRRRQRTRWLLVTPLLGLALIVGGVVWLEAIAPQLDVTDRRVDGVPPLAIDEDPSCMRPDVDEVADDLRARFPPGGRVSSTQVFQCPAAFDGLDVTYVGEPVGDLLDRRGGVWAQVNDDVYALEVGPVIGHRERAGFNTGMSVWLPDGTHEAIEAVGRPGVRGDVLLIRGTLLRADPADGGGTTIRAESVEVLADAIEIPKPFHPVQAVVAAVLALAALGSMLWSRAARRR